MKSAGLHSVPRAPALLCTCDVHSSLWGCHQLPNNLPQIGLSAILFCPKESFANDPERRGRAKVPLAINSEMAKTDTPVLGLGGRG